MSCLGFQTSKGRYAVLALPPSACLAASTSLPTSVMAPSSPADDGTVTASGSRVVGSREASVATSFHLTCESERRRE